MSNPLLWPYDDLIHAYWVEPRSILAGEYPGNADPIKARTKIELLCDNGIRTFIDLTQPADGLTPYDSTLDAVGLSRGVDLVRIPHPIPDMGVLPTNQYDDILESVHRSADNGGVYIHCWGGIGRTATVVGCLFVEMGLSGEGAMRTIKERRADTRKANMRAPQTHQQRDVIFQRAAKRP